MTRRRNKPGGGGGGGGGARRERAVGPPPPPLQPEPPCPAAGAGLSDEAAAAGLGGCEEPVRPGPEAGLEPEQEQEEQGPAPEVRSGAAVAGWLAGGRAGGRVPPPLRPRIPACGAGQRSPAGGPAAGSAFSPGHGCRGEAGGGPEPGGPPLAAAPRRRRMTFPLPRSSLRTHTPSPAAAVTGEPGAHGCPPLLPCEMPKGGPEEDDLPGLGGTVPHPGPSKPAGFAHTLPAI
ncbi:collagen alpha-1(I) chain-like [Trichosurus vulpecula]|uniref:collagen alpha-1(I) chain-like n=1 Tax=Trichosurus vulpecula TaxID=9337 RepID=UPI00186B5138|nr:collagen alpha-1(I) chain-like [Trichosurus vulpecula]